MCVIDGQLAIERRWRQRSDTRDSFGILRVWCLSGSFALVMQADRAAGDLFVLSLCTVLESSFSSLLYLMPCEKVSVIGKDCFFITLFFCIVSLKLINIQIEIVNFCQICRCLGYTGPCVWCKGSRSHGVLGLVVVEVHLSWSACFLFPFGLL